MSMGRGFGPGILGGIYGMPGMPVAAPRPIYGENGKIIGYEGPNTSGSPGGGGMGGGGGGLGDGTILGDGAVVSDGTAVSGGASAASTAGTLPWWNNDTPWYKDLWNWTKNQGMNIGMDALKSWIMQWLAGDPEFDPLLQENAERQNEIGRMQLDQLKKTQGSYNNLQYNNIPSDIALGLMFEYPWNDGYTQRQYNLADMIGNIDYKSLGEANRDKDLLAIMTGVYQPGGILGNAQSREQIAQNHWGSVGDFGSVASRQPLNDVQSMIAQMIQDAMDRRS